MKNVLLIHPSRKILGEKDNLYTNESLVPSLGLSSITAYARQQGINAAIIDLRLSHHGIEDTLEWIKKNNPVLVGITAFTTEITAANIIAGMIKEVFPQLPVIVGGPHPSQIPGETLSEFKNIDIVVIGEGEKTIVELVQIFESNKTEEISNVQGIAFRNNGEIIINQARQPIEDIDSLPFPAWDLFELKYYNKIFPISTSRGCPYRCYFCSPNYLGKKIRIKQYNNIVNEISWLVDKYGAEHIQFADATMGLLKDEAILLCEEIIKRELNKKISWDCEIRADSVNMTLLGKMKEAGCGFVAFGVESGNEFFLKEIIKKGETKDQIKNAVNMSQKAGLKVRCFFILGHYTETVETIKETIKFALELNPDALSFGLMVPNPGTEFRKLAEEGAGGLKILHNTWENYQQFNYDCLESESLSLQILKKWQSNAYFTFYLHHPFKALGLFFSQSAYNYSFKGIIKIPIMLLKNKFKKNA